MAFVRSIGRWTMTAVVVNSLIGSGPFALPGELNRLLGRASPFAMIFAAVAMAIIVACIAEVASQFSEPGGAYLYTRTAFGRFVGMQIAWFFLLRCRIYATASFPSTRRAYSSTLVSLIPNCSTIDAMFIASPCESPSSSAAKLFGDGKRTCSSPGGPAPTRCGLLRTRVSCRDAATLALCPRCDR